MKGRTILGMLIGVSLTRVYAGVLLQDTFDGGNWADREAVGWLTKAPTQWVEGGWLHTQDRDGWPRDSDAVVHDGDPAWTDYTVFTVLQMMGDGLVDHANLLLRTSGFLQTSDSATGRAYQLGFIGPRGWDGQSRNIHLVRVDFDANSVRTLAAAGWPLGGSALNVIASLQGGRIRVWVGTVGGLGLTELLGRPPLFDVVDPNPFPHGGVGVHAIWEAHARFDSIRVIDDPVPESGAPDPERRWSASGPPVPIPGLVARWSLDGNAQDTKNGYDGVVLGPGIAIPIPDGRFGGAYRFDQNGSIWFGDVLNGVFAKPFSVTSWIRTWEPAQTEVWRVWFHKIDNDRGEGPLELLLNDGRRFEHSGPNAPAAMGWEYWGIGEWSVSDNGQGVNARDGLWHHVAVSYSPEVQRLYFDGVLVGSGPPAAISSTSLPLMMGGSIRPDGRVIGPYHHYWIGDVDETLVYDRVLTTEEVRWLAGSHLPIRGDLNGDGWVDSVDLGILMIRLRARTQDLGNDLNGDGWINIADARWLQLHFTR